MTEPVLNPPVDWPLESAYTNSKAPTSALLPRCVDVLRATRACEIRVCPWFSGTWNYPFDGVADAVVRMVQRTDSVTNVKIRENRVGRTSASPDRLQLSNTRRQDTAAPCPALRHPPASLSLRIRTAHKIDRARRRT